MRLPYPSMPPGALALETSARVFHRSVQLGVLRPPDRRHRDAWFDVIAASTWRHADQQTAAPALSLKLETVDATDLLLVVDEGDNAPLPITSARLLLPSYRLRFFQPPDTELRLAYGRDDLGPPKYDLALLASEVMGAPAREVEPAREPGRRAAGAESFISPRMFWAFLAVAVVALVAVIAKLLGADFQR
jgi:hypothetical protein